MIPPVTSGPVRSQMTIFTIKHSHGHGKNLHTQDFHKVNKLRKITDNARHQHCSIFVTARQ